MSGKLWIGSIIALGVLDFWAARTDRNTLSCTARRIFRTNTVAGKAAWVVGWTGLSVWLIPHIIKNTEDAVEELIHSVV